MENCFTLPAIIGVGYYNSASFRQTGKTDLRTTAFYELELPTEPIGVLHIDGGDYPVSPDFVVVTKPGLSRRCTLPYRCLYIHIAPVNSELCRGLDNLPVIVPLDEPEKMRGLFSDVLEAASKEPQPHGVALIPERDNLIIYSKLFEIIAKLHSLSSEAAIPRNIPKSIGTALALIDAHPEHMYTLQEFSAMVHLNPMYFGRLFQSVVGKTPFRYMMDKKIMIAKNMLLSTDKPCGEIGELLGFSSESHFSYTFRHETGMTPSEFRKHW